MKLKDVTSIIKKTNKFTKDTWKHETDNSPEGIRVRESAIDQESLEKQKEMLKNLEDSPYKRLEEERINRLENKEEGVRLSDYIDRDKERKKVRLFNWNLVGIQAVGLGTGATIGAVVGSAIGGPVGTIAGAAIGVAAGAVIGPLVRKAAVQYLIPAHKTFRKVKTFVKKEIKQVKEKSITKENKQQNSPQQKTDSPKHKIESIKHESLKQESLLDQVKQLTVPDNNAIAKPAKELNTKINNQKKKSVNTRLTDRLKAKSKSNMKLSV